MVKATLKPFWQAARPRARGSTRLTGAGIAERDNVLPTQDELAAGQFEHQHLVEARDGGEVEGVEALHRREFGPLYPPLDWSAP